MTTEPGFYWARRAPDAPWEIVRIATHPDLGPTWATPFDRAPVPAYRFQLGPRIDPPVARPAAEYHEDMGPVLWWRFPVNEPPVAGYGSEWLKSSGPSITLQDYYTHWTPIAIPVAP